MNKKSERQKGREDILKSPMMSNFVSCASILHKMQEKQGFLDHNTWDCEGKPGIPCRALKAFNEAIRGI